MFVVIMGTILIVLVIVHVVATAYMHEAFYTNLPPKAQAHHIEPACTLQRSSLMF